MKILALDTATAACSVALWVDGVIASRRFEAMAQGHAETLVPMIDAVMAEAEESFEALDFIASTVGPGTFTGLRVGLATARGLALAVDRPLVGVTTLEAIAQATKPGERAGRSVLAVIDARRGELYVQAFDGDITPLAPARSLALQAVLDDRPSGPLLLVGDGAALIEQPLASAGSEPVISGAPDLPDAVQVAVIAARRPESARPGHDVAPLYLRGPGARLPRNAGAFTGRDVG